MSAKQGLRYCKRNVKEDIIVEESKTTNTTKHAQDLLPGIQSEEDPQVEMMVACIVACEGGRLHPIPSSDSAEHSKSGIADRTRSAYCPKHQIIGKLMRGVTSAGEGGRNVWRQHDRPVISEGPRPWPWPTPQRWNTELHQNKF